MKATEQYFPVVLFIMLYKVIPTFESMDEILKCDHSIESYWAALFCGAVYYAVQGGSNFWVCGLNPKVWPFKWKQPRSTFLLFGLLLTVLFSVIWKFSMYIKHCVGYLLRASSVNVTRSLLMNTENSIWRLCCSMSS